MNKIMRLPAVPLITHDPYFSIWHPGDVPTCEDTKHWSGTRKAMRGRLVIDGISRRFLGRTGREAMDTIACTITPLSTSYILEALGIRLKMTFTSPLLLDDFDVLSTPVSFVDLDVEFTDGKQHTVELEFSLLADFCHSGEIEEEVWQDFFTDHTLNFGYMGNMRQTPLAGSGDRITCDWGYLFVASEDTVDNYPDSTAWAIRVHKESDQPFQTRILIGYDDIVSINYFGKLLPAYYARNGKTIVDAIKEFHMRRDELLERCRQFDESLIAEARANGGEDLELITTAAYRQAIAGHKLVEGPDGEILFISKENDSNGCAATSDISAPSSALFLLFAPELVRGMCRPILKFARQPIWKYEYAPHDAGRYPMLVGQQYAVSLRPKGNRCGSSIAPYYLYPASAELYREDQQMPVEESGNMILLMAAAGRADGDWSLCRDNVDLLRKWVQFLVDQGDDPGYQLCTDDFMGHLAHNVNLSAKAFCGVAAFAEIMKALGNEEESNFYMEKARTMAAYWLERVGQGEFTPLSFDGTGWSLKYNLVWDRLFGWGLLPDSFYEKEIASYIPRMNPYGMPLDSRSRICKTEWAMWIAAMADEKQRPAFYAPLAKFLRESSSRVPFPDYIDSIHGTYEVFTARTVQGGVFMPLLMDRWKQK